MGRRVPKWTEAKIAQRIREGYGQGTRANYKPWLTVRDFSSQGTTTRIFSPKLGRAVTLFSNIERNAFFVCEFDELFDDFWEQLPIPRDESLDIAASLGVRHPVYPGTRIPIVMTLDGVFSQRTATGIERIAIDCKPETALLNPRTKQKLAINEEYARRHGYDYLRFSELSVPQSVVHNIQWVRMSATRSGDVQGPLSNADVYRTRLLGALQRSATEPLQRKSVRKFLQDFDAEWLLPAGAGLRLLRELMWTHDAEFDFETPYQSVLAGPLSALQPRATSATLDYSPATTDEN